MHSTLRPDSSRRSRPLLSLALTALVYAHAGSALAGWQINGSPVTPVPLPQEELLLQGLAPDGHNGAYVVWRTTNYYVEANQSRLSATRVNAAGTRPSPWVQAGSSLWPEEGLDYLPLTIGVIPFGTGVLSAHLAGPGRRLYLNRIGLDGTVQGLPSISEPGNQDDNGVAIDSDGTGGLLLASDDASGAPSVRRLDATGATSWGPVVLAPSGSVTAMLADESGGAFVAYRVEAQRYVQHLDANGAIAAGWPTAGAAVPGARQLASDGAGGVYIEWLHYGPPLEPSIRVHHLLAGGTLHPGVPAGGRILLQSQYPFYGAGVKLVGDAQGGAYLALLPYSSEPATTRLHHLGAATEPLPGWSEDGLALTNQDTSNPNFDLLADGSGGVYVSFRNGVGPAAPRGLYVQHFTGDGQIAGGWPAAPGFRLSDTGEASAIVRSGYGIIVAWDDTRLSRRGVYAQRVDIDVLPTGVGDPPVLARTELALESPQPNPSRRGVSLALTLPDARPAKLDVLDLAGRRVGSRDLIALGAGRHVVNLDEVAALAPGLYLLQLTHGGESRRAKLVRVR